MIGTVHDPGRAGLPPGQDARQRVPTAFAVPLRSPERNEVTRERRSPTRREADTANPNCAGSETGAPRSVRARERAAAARAALADCRLCAHDCGVNRLAGATGLCHAGAEARFFSAQIEVSDELELIPTFAIALSGCDLRCDFCITGGPSWNPRAGEPLRVDELAARARAPWRMARAR